MSAYGQPDETADVHSEFLSMFPRTPIPEEVQPAPSPSEQIPLSDLVFQKSNSEQMIPDTGDSSKHNHNYQQTSIPPSVCLRKPTRSNRNRSNRKDLFAATDLSNDTQPYNQYRYDDPTQDQGATSLSFIHQHTTTEDTHFSAFKPAAFSPIQKPDSQTDGKSARLHSSARCLGND